ncbi:MAG: hypothetical protein Q8O95_06330 [bacterium]|nr:hypothetical protein [bacterium]
MLNHTTLFYFRKFEFWEESVIMERCHLFQSVSDFSVIYWVLLGLLLGIVAVYDALFRLIPLFLMVLVLLVCLVSPVFTGIDFSAAGLGALIVGGLVFLIYAVTRGKGIGEADVVMALAIGLIFGWSKGLVVFSAANFLGLIILLPFLLVLGKKRLRQIPLVTFMVLAIFLEWFFSFSDQLFHLIGVA